MWEKIRISRCKWILLAIQTHFKWNEGFIPTEVNNNIFKLQNQSLKMFRGSKVSLI